MTTLRDQIAAALRDADVARLRAEGRVPISECPCGGDDDADRARSCRTCDSRGEHAGNCDDCADLRPLADLPSPARAPYYSQADAVLAVVGPVLAEAAAFISRARESHVGLRGTDAYHAQEYSRADVALARLAALGVRP